MNKHRKFNRRTLLRGAVKGSAVVVGLPILESFLNEMVPRSQLMVAHYHLVLGAGFGVLA